MLIEEIDKATRDLSFGPADDLDELARQMKATSADELERAATTFPEANVQFSQRIDQFNHRIAQNETILEEQKRLEALLPPVPGQPDIDDLADPDAEIEALRSSPRSHDNSWKLAELLMQQDKHDEAFAVLRERVEAGDRIQRCGCQNFWQLTAAKRKP